MTVEAAVKTVVIVKKVPWFRVLLAIFLSLWLMWHYFVYPSIDRLTPWKGVVPDLTPWDGILPGAYQCGATPEPEVQAAGFSGMFHDAGAGLRSVAAGPPTADDMIGWYRSAGEAVARSISFFRDGISGRVLSALPISGPLTDEQVAVLAQEVGWPAQEVPHVVSRVRAESSGNPTARDYVTGTHWGLLQLGPAERAQYLLPGESADDPRANLSASLRLWQARGWQPWASSDGAVETVAGCAAESSAVAVAQRYLGTPYRWGGETPGGFDCSGLVQYVEAQVGVQAPRTAEEQRRWAQPVRVGDVQSGDLVFFQKSPGAPAHHVGIVAGPGMMIDAPHTGATVHQRAIYGGEIITYGRVPGPARTA